MGVGFRNIRFETTVANTNIRLYILGIGNFANNVNLVGCIFIQCLILHLKNCLDNNVRYIA